MLCGSKKIGWRNVGGVLLEEIIVSSAWFKWNERR